MSKFKNDEERSVPEIGTASLPDIVFMLLFFFMVATTTRQVDPMVSITPAKGSGVTDLTPFKQRSEVDFVYLGEPLNGDKSKFEDGIAVQYGGIVAPNGIYHIGQWKEKKFENKPPTMTAPRENIITCFKADKAVPIGIIFKARGILQDLNFNSIAYGAQKMGNSTDYDIRTK